MTMERRTNALEGQSTARPPFFDSSNYTCSKTNMTNFLTLSDFDL